MYMRFNVKKISLWALFFAQIILIVSYLYVAKYSKSPNILKRISFPVSNDIKNSLPAYRTLGDTIYLKTLSTTEYFIDFNSSLCFTGGTDVKAMIAKEINWKCICLPGWHGKDCGQPEVLLRALLAYKKALKMKGPRSFQRHIIYLFEVSEFSEYLTEMRIFELADIVDLFVLYETRGDYILRKLNNKFCQEYQDKILYVPGTQNNLWNTVSKYIHNLKKDDIVLISKSYEIPNKDTLVFLRYYENISQPIGFRLKWSVYGFFWLHPKQTLISGGACTVKYLKETFSNNLTLLSNNITGLINNKGIIFGDLNHTGGWFCEYCNSAMQIVEYLAAKSDTNDWKKLMKQPLITTQFVEALIQNGLYIDGKLELLRTHKSSDNYFAPTYVMDHDWKYDFLLINFYSQMDYYE